MNQSAFDVKQPRRWREENVNAKARRIFGFSSLTHDSRLENTAILAIFEWNGFFRSMSTTSVSGAFVVVMGIPFSLYDHFMAAKTGKLICLLNINETYCLHFSTEKRTPNQMWSVFPYFVYFRSFIHVQLEVEEEGKLVACPSGAVSRTTNLKTINFMSPCGRPSSLLCRMSAHFVIPISICLPFNLQYSLTGVSRCGINHAYCGIRFAALDSWYQTHCVALYPQHSLCDSHSSQTATLQCVLHTPNGIQS